MGTCFFAVVPKRLLAVAAAALAVAHAPIALVVSDLPGFAERL